MFCWEKLSAGEILSLVKFRSLFPVLVGGNYSSEEISVTWPKSRHFSPTKFFPDKVAHPRNREKFETGSSAKLNPREMLKFRGCGDPRNLIPLN